MQTTILLFHPHLEDSRVNKALAQAAERKNHVAVRNMYNLYPDFKVDVAKEQANLLGADRVVLQFPTYWYSSPALLKQWEDAVLQHGWAYGSQGNQLHGKELVVATSTGGGRENYTVQGLHGYRLAELMRPFQSMANMVGMKYARPFFTFGGRTITDPLLNAQARKYANYISQDKALPLLGHFATEEDYRI